MIRKTLLFCRLVWRRSTKDKQEELCECFRILAQMNSTHFTHSVTNSPVVGFNQPATVLCMYAIRYRTVRYGTVQYSSVQYSRKLTGLGLCFDWRRFMAHNFRPPPLSPLPVSISISSCPSLALIHQPAVLRTSNVCNKHTSQSCGEPKNKKNKIERNCCY